MLNRIAKKGKKGFGRLIFSRIGIIALMLIVQFAVIFAIFNWLGSYLPYMWVTSLAFTTAVFIYLMNCAMSPNAKLTWLTLIMITPVFGSLLLVFTKTGYGHRKLREHFNNLTELNRDRIKPSPETEKRLGEKNEGILRLTEYVAKSGCFPVFENTRLTYFPSGEEKFKRLLEELEKAESFIFLEYFIIDEGRMWGDILEILERKAKNGVDVRVIYDGMCEFTTLPRSFAKKLFDKGIKCRAFAPLTPFISTHYNYRDHRKIAVIDGRAAFNGGVNLADEYINEKERFGHWKDSAVMLEGSAVRSFTLMFLQMWDIEEQSAEYGSYLTEPRAVPSDGFVMPFSDCPVDVDKVGERVYMDILARATDYVHIMTPYLILDSELECSLKFAAERGVDVKIILPGIPDKKSAWALAKTHYRALLSSGVELYEYTPGFVHAKSFVSDSREAVVGTINLDYRSLYHHFECATYFAYSEAVNDVEKDFSDTLEKCKRVTYESIKKEKIIIKLRGTLLKIIAPLM